MKMINRFSKFTIFPEIKKGHKYYYAAKTYREKINPQHSGKTRGSGKSKVICDKIYLGTAEDVLTKLFSAKTSPHEVSSKEFGLPMSVLKLSHDTGIMDIIDEVLPYKVRGIKASEFIIISAISKLHGSISKARTDDKTGDYFNTTVLPEVMGIKGNNLNSKTYWEMFDKIISEKELKNKKRAKEKQFNDKLSIEELEELIDDEKLQTIEEKIWLNLLQKYHILLDLLLYDGTNCWTYYQDHTINSYGQKGKNKKGRHKVIGLQNLDKESESLDSLNSSLNDSIELINIMLSLITVLMLSMVLSPLLPSLLLTTTSFALICPLITKHLFNCLNCKIFPLSRVNGRKSYPLLFKVPFVCQRSIPL